MLQLYCSTAEGETGHAHGHLEFRRSWRSATGEPIGSTAENLKALLLVKHMSIQTQPAWRALHVKKVLMKLPIGLKHLPKQRNSKAVSKGTGFNGQFPLCVS